MQIHFILVEPELPENVGACARALKTMGFSSLRLVNPCDYLSDRARWLAYGSYDILKRASVFSSLNKALQGMDIIIGTTAKDRTIKYGHFPAEEIPGILQSKGSTLRNTAMVFGRESNGLNNGELRLCDILTRIPMKAAYPSLNLGQAVMLFAYILSPLSLGSPVEQEDTPFEQQGLRELKVKVNAFLKNYQVPNKFGYYEKLQERICLLGKRDIRLLHFLLEKLNG